MKKASKRTLSPCAASKQIIKLTIHENEKLHFYRIISEAT
jgi:hypothetical protein